MDFGDFDCRPCPSTHIFMKYVNRLGMLKSPEIGRNAIKISFLDRHVNPISTGLFCLVVALGGGGGVFSTPLL